MPKSLLFPHAETVYKPIPNVPVAEWCPRFWLPGNGFQPAAAITKGPPLKVYANHGRWLINCPCGGAQYASQTDPRFWCVDCRNYDSGGLWRRISWPEAVLEIETLLAARPESKRNWLPGETLDDLKVENVLHGITI